MKALIFDFDGLIVDTEMPALKAWQMVYEEHGHELEHERWVEYFLGSQFDPLARLGELCLGTLDLNTARTRRDNLKTELCNAQPLLPGVREWIDGAVGLGIYIAVASSSRRPWVTHHLTRCGIIDSVQVICTREDVENAKPAPDLFLLAAQKLEVAPADCLVIEDSPNGLKAAIAAGMECIVIPNALTSRIPFVNHRWHAASLASVDLNDFLGKIRSEVN